MSSSSSSSSSSEDLNKHFPGLNSSTGPPKSMVAANKVPSSSPPSQNLSGLDTMSKRKDSNSESKSDSNAGKSSSTERAQRVIASIRGSDKGSTPSASPSSSSSSSSSLYRTHSSSSASSKSSTTNSSNEIENIDLSITSPSPPPPTAGVSASPRSSKIQHRLKPAGEGCESLLTSNPVAKLKSQRLEDHHGKQLCISEDDNFVAYAVSQSQIRVLHLPTTARAVLKGHTGRVCDLQFTKLPNTHELNITLASLDTNDQAIVWEINASDDTNETKLKWRSTLRFEPGENESFQRIAWCLPSSLNISGVYLILAHGGSISFVLLNSELWARAQRMHSGAKAGGQDGAESVLYARDVAHITTTALRGNIADVSVSVAHDSVLVCTSAGKVAQYSIESLVLSERTDPFEVINIPHSRAADSVVLLEPGLVLVAAESNTELSLWRNQALEHEIRLAAASDGSVLQNCMTVIRRAVIDPNNRQLVVILADMNSETMVAILIDPSQDSFQRLVQIKLSSEVIELVAAHNSETIFCRQPDFISMFNPDLDTAFNTPRVNPPVPIVHGTTVLGHSPSSKGPPPVGLFRTGQSSSTSSSSSPPPPPPSPYVPASSVAAATVPSSNAVPAPASVPGSTFTSAADRESTIESKHIDQSQLQPQATASTNASLGMNGNTVSDTSSLDELLTSKLDQLFDRIEKRATAREEAAKGREKVLLEAMSSTLDEVSDMVDNMSNKSAEATSQSVMDTFRESILPQLEASFQTAVKSAMETSVHSAITQSLSTELSKSSPALVSNIAKGVQEPVSKAFETHFKQAVVPAFESGCQVMVKQLQQDFQKRTGEQVERLRVLQKQNQDEIFERIKSIEQMQQRDYLVVSEEDADDQYFDDMPSSSSSYSTQKQQPSQSQPQPQSQPQLQRSKPDQASQTSKTPQAPQAKQASSSAAPAPSQSPSPSGSTSAQSKPQPPSSAQQQSQHQQDFSEEATKIMNLLQVGEYEEAFRTMLTAMKLPLVHMLTNRIDPAVLFEIQPTPLSQGILLSLVQQVSVNLPNDPQNGLQWIYHALKALDITDPSMASNAKSLLSRVQENLKRQEQVLSVPGSETESYYRSSLAMISDMLKKL